MNIDLSQLKKEYTAYDLKREKLIKKSRDLLKSAKQLIYAIHKGNASECKVKEKALMKEFNVLDSFIEKENRLKYEGSYNEAAEEYAEAMLYYDYMFCTSLRKPFDLNITSENYLGALSDLTGELGRKAVQLTIKKKYDEVYEIKEFVEKIFKEMMDFTFRNSQLRKKYDAIKWNLNKIEDILYDIEIKR